MPRHDRAGAKRDERKHDPLAVQLERDQMLQPKQRQKGEKREAQREQRSGAASAFVDRDLSRKILSQAREQLDEEEGQFGAGVVSSSSSASSSSSSSSSSAAAAAAG